MVAITQNQITDFKLRIQKAFNEFATAGTTTIYNMRIVRHSTDSNALDLIFSIHCEIATPKYSAFERFVRISKGNYDPEMMMISNDTSEIIIRTSYTLKPIKEVQIIDIHTSLLKTIDQLQETINVLYKNESNIPILNVFSDANFISQTDSAIQEFFKQDGTPFKIPRFD